MKRITATMTLLMTLLGMASVVTTANADDYRRINRDARTIERKAKLLLRESDHYTATRQYRHLVCDLEDFVQLSQHITDLVRVSGNLRHIKSDVAQLDATFHHLEGLFDQIERDVARGRAVKCGNTAHVKRLLNNLEDCIHHMQEDIAVLEVRAHARSHDRDHDHGYRGRSTGYYQPPVTNYYRPPTTSYYRAPSSSYYRAPSSSRVINSRDFYYNNGYDRGRSCPNSRNSGIGFSIGGGSSRIQIRF